MDGKGWRRGEGGWERVEERGGERRVEERGGWMGGEGGGDRF